MKKPTIFLVVAAAVIVSSLLTLLIASRPTEVFDDGRLTRCGLSPGWAISPTIDSLTGQKSVEYATTMTTLDGSETLTGQLRLRCLSNSLDAYVSFSGFFTLRNSFWSVSQNGAVMVSFLHGKAATQGRMAFLDDGDVKTFLSLLVEDHDVRIRLRVVEGPQITFKPEMKHAAETIAKVRAECNA